MPPVVFVSYARKDDASLAYASLVEHLEGMERRGVITLRVDQRLNAGEVVDPAIKQWIMDGHVTVALLSKKYFKSEYITEVEIPLLAKKKKGDQSYRIMPVILNDCMWDKYSLFKSRTITPNEDVTLENMSLSERGRLIKALAEKIEDVCTEIAPSVSKSMSSLPASILQPVAPIGREVETARAISALKTFPALLLYGPPGQGKTELARAVALEQSQVIDAPCYEISLENERKVDNLMPTLTDALGLPSESNPIDFLSSNQCVLLLDGLDLILAKSEGSKVGESIKSLINAAHEGSKIILTCQKEFEVRGLRGQLVHPLADDESLALFNLSSDDEFPNVDDDLIIDFLRDGLSNHPYSILIMGKYCRALKLSFENLKKLWGEKWDDIANSSPSLDQRGLFASFELTFETLSGPQKSFFVGMSMFPDGADRALLEEVFPGSDIELNENLGVLRDRGLLDERLHAAGVFRLLGPIFRYSSAKYVSSIETNKSLKEFSESVDTYFDTVVADNAPERNNEHSVDGLDIIRSQFHNIHSSLDRRLIPSTKSSARSSAETVLKLYWAYHNNLVGNRNAISSTEDTIHYLQRARDVFVANESHDEVVQCLHYMGSILWLRGLIEAARKHLSEAIQSEECTLEIKLNCQRAFAHMEYKTGSLLEADRLYLNVSKAAEAFPDQSIRLKCEVGRIDVFRKLGRYKEGLQIYADTAEELSDVHPSTRGNAIRGKAFIEFLTGDTVNAQGSYLSALSEYVGLPFGQAHCHRGLGDIFTELGDYRQAEEHFSNAISLYDLARKNPSLGVGLVFLGRARMNIKRNNLGAAQKILRDVAALCSKEELNEPFELAVSYELMGDTYSLNNEFDEAVGYYNLAQSGYRLMESNYHSSLVAKKATAIGTER